MPFQIQQIDALHKIRDLALLTTLAAVLAVIGSVSGGAISDRTHSRFGRRSPWLVTMSVVSAVLMIALGTLHNLTVIAILYAALWFCMNFYQAVLSAIIPDRVPESSRGTISSAFGLGGALGLGIGVNAVAHVSLGWGYIILAGLVVTTTALCVVFVREWASPELPKPPHSQPATSTKYSWLGLFQGFLSLDFTLAFITRAMSFTALAVVAGYTYYVLQDHIGAANLPGHSVKSALGILVVAQTIAWIAGVTGAGWFSDRLNRRKLFVGICLDRHGCFDAGPVAQPDLGRDIDLLYSDRIFLRHISVRGSRADDAGSALTRK